MRKKVLESLQVVAVTQSTHFNDGFQSCIIYNTWQISAFLLVISSFLIVLVRVHGISPEFLPCTSQEEKKNVCGVELFECF